MEKEWQQWKKQHGKHYADEVEESVRRAVWFRTYYHTQAHNQADIHPYTLGMNRFSDMVSVCVKLQIMVPIVIKIDKRRIQNIIPHTWS